MTFGSDNFCQQPLARVKLKDVSFFANAEGREKVRLSNNASGIDVEQLGMHRAFKDMQLQLGHIGADETHTHKINPCRLH